MGGASSYLALLAICGFLSAAWMATKVSKLAGVSSIVLEITTGVILGPRVLGLISPVYAQCQHRTYSTCVPGPDFLERLDRGLPVGADLARIVDEHLCDRGAYAHGDEHHSALHGMQASTGLDDESGAEVVGHVGGHESAGRGPAAPPAAAVDTEADSADDAHAAAHIAPAGNAHGAADAAAAEGHGAHRRLSGGGGSYASFEQCVQKSCEAEIAHNCGLTPDVFTLIGHTGVALMIFESGMHFDFEKASVVGPKACAIAVVGTILPLAAGTLLTVIYGRPLVPDGLAVGTALAPTSVGIALRLLGEAGVLQQDFGQAIITAAFVDDILSLVLFNVLFSFRGDFDVMATVVNPVVGVVLMGAAMFGAVKFWPRAINEWILPRFPKKSEYAKVSTDDEVLFLVMMALLVAYASITHFLGTHLWGCFIAGMSFACVDKAGHKGHAHHVWVRQTKRITTWMIRIFFASTVAFSIPVQELLSFEAFWKGTIMGFGPCILTKVCCAPFMGSARFVIGWAMVGRAEFAYLIAQMAAAAGMIDEATFSIAIWALLYATIFAPFAFRTVLNRYIAAQGIDAVADRNFAASEGESESEEEFADDRFERVVVAKKRLDMEGADLLDTQQSRLYGKALEELDWMTLEKLRKGQKKQYRKERNGEAMDHPDASSPPEASQSGVDRRVRRGFWAGRATTPVDHSNGFWCCLYLK